MNRAQAGGAKYELRAVGGGFARGLNSFYLTEREVRDLLRVACAEAPVVQVVSVIRKAYRGAVRLVIAACVAYIGFLGLALAHYGSVEGVFVALSFGGLGWFLVEICLIGGWRSRKLYVVDRLLGTIRVLDRRSGFNACGRKVQVAADTFYRTYRRRGVRQPPSSFRVILREPAVRGAQAIASQMWRLDGSDPSYEEAADDLRRAILRVVAKDVRHPDEGWRQVERLDVSAGRQPLWEPGSSLTRLARFVTQDPVATHPGSPVPIPNIDS